MQWQLTDIKGPFIEHFVMGIFAYSKRQWGIIIIIIIFSWVCTIPTVDNTALQGGILLPAPENQLGHVNLANGQHAVNSRWICSYIFSSKYRGKPNKQKEQINLINSVENEANNQIAVFLR